MTSNTGKPRMMVFATGEKDGGGSGLLEMGEYSLTNPPGLDVNIVAAISNHENGGVSVHADTLKIPFRFWDGPFNAEGYQALVDEFNPDMISLSGWLKLTVGLDVRKAVNIHPGLIPGRGEHGEFGGLGLYGKNVHIAAIKAFHQGRITQSGVTIHFANEKYDEGPTIWRMPVLIREEDTPESLANRVNQVERAWQSHVINLVANRQVILRGEPKNWEVTAHMSLKNFPGIQATAWFT